MLEIFRDHERFEELLGQVSKCLARELLGPLCGLVCQGLDGPCDLVVREQDLQGFFILLDADHAASQQPLNITLDFWAELLWWQGVVGHRFGVAVRSSGFTCQRPDSIGLADHKGRTVLARNPLGRLAPARPRGAGLGIPVLGFYLLLGFARLPGEDLLGREAKFLNELQNGLEGLFGLCFLGVSDLLVEEFFLSEEFGVAGHTGALG